MLGISVDRLQTLTWTVAGLLSFASIFFEASTVGLPLDPTFDLTHSSPRWRRSAGSLSSQQDDSWGS